MSLLNKDPYLRNRPFFLVYLRYVPAKVTAQDEVEQDNPTVRKFDKFKSVSSKRKKAKPQTADTRVRGWAYDGTGLDQLERYEVTDRVSNNHLRNVPIILDVFNMKLVKNDTQTPNDLLLKTLYDRYDQEIAEITEGWLTAKARELLASGDVDPEQLPSRAGNGDA